MILALVLAATGVHVSNQGCKLKPDEVQRIAQLELGRGPDKTMEVVLRCDGATFEVQIDDPVTGKTLSRRFPQREVPSRAGERFAALAIAELAEASWSELLLPAPTTVAVASNVDRQSAEAAVKTLPTRRVRVLALVVGRGWPNAGVLQLGGAVRGHVTLVGPFGLSIDLGAESGRRRVSGGSMSADAIGGGAHATLRAEVGPFQLLGGLGVRAFGQRLVGLPDAPTEFEGRTVSAFLAGPSALAELSVALGRVDLSLTVEPGVLPRGLVGSSDGSAVGGVFGWWLTGSIGLGWRW